MSRDPQPATHTRAHMDARIAPGSPASALPQWINSPGALLTGVVDTATREHMSPRSHMTARLDDGLLDDLETMASRLGWTRSQVLEVLVRIGLRVVHETEGRAEELIALAAAKPKPRRKRRSK